MKSKAEKKAEWGPGWRSRNQSIIQRLEGISAYIERRWDRLFEGRDERGYALSRRQDEEIKDEDIRDEYLNQTWGLPPSSPDSAPWED